MQSFQGSLSSATVQKGGGADDAHVVEILGRVETIPLGERSRIRVGDESLVRELDATRQVLLVTLCVVRREQLDVDLGMVTLVEKDSSVQIG